MKKITNNANAGKFTMILNIVFFVALIVAMITLLKFDKENVQLVSATPKYEDATHSLQEAQQPLRADSINVAYYQDKVDSLTKIAAQDKKSAAAVKEDLQRYKDILAEKQQQKAVTDSVVADAVKAYEPIKTEYDSLTQATDAKFSTFFIFYVFVLVLLVAKIAVFAVWNYKNSKNLHTISSWMKYGEKPYWAWLGWIIPILHLIKPYKYFTEIWDETDYALKDKAIISKNSSEDSDFLIGMWWGTWLLSLLVFFGIVTATFFGTGSMYYKFGHETIAIISLVVWAVYLLFESVMISKYMGMNKKLVENEAKFLDK